jgi:hypothetical protein
MTVSPAPAVNRALGYGGLIPFVLPALLVVSGSGHGPAVTALAGSYALAIICFICGSWWGMAQASATRATLWLSNAYLLLALLLYLFASQWWSLSAALLLLGAWVCEQSSGLFPAYPRDYRRLRAMLTLVAASSMGILQFAT